MGEVQVELTGGWGNRSRSFSWATEFFFPLPEAAVHIWQQDPGAPTICRDTRFYDLLSVRFMEMMYDQQFFILSSQEQERKRGSGPLRYRGSEFQDPNPGPPHKGGPRLGGAASPPSSRHSLWLTAATIYLIKMGYSGAMWRYV